MKKTLVVQTEILEKGLKVIYNSPKILILYKIPSLPTKNQKFLSRIDINIRGTIAN